MIWDNSGAAANHNVSTCVGQKKQNVIESIH